jgi:hypothetical protein
MLEARDGKAIYAQKKAERPARAYEMFAGGLDTLQISHRFGIREPVIHRWITMERSRRLNLFSPYETRKNQA